MSIVVVEGSRELLSHSGGRDVDRWCVLSYILFKDSFGCRFVLRGTEGGGTGIPKEIDIGGIVKV